MLLSFPRTQMKRAREPDVSEIVGVRGVSRAALERIVSALSRQDAGRSAAALTRQAHEQRWAKVATCLKMPSVDGGMVDWHLCHPNRMLALLVEESPALQTWLRDAFRRVPCTPLRPWSLLVGFDEYVPGSKLAPIKSRKTMCLSFSFEELSPQLHLDSAWFTPAAVLTTTMHKVEGGWSAMLRAFLSLQLLGPTGLSTAGLPLVLGDEAHILFARIGTVLSDGDGLRQALQWSGAGGLRPCFRHPNVLMKNSDRAGRQGGDDYVEIGCADPSRFASWTRESLASAVRMTLEKREQLGHRRGVSTELDRMAKAFGFAFTKD